MQPKVSVIVPAYQAQQHLSRCLSSLVKQTLSEIEIIVINDGSTDQTQTIINQFKLNYPHLITIEQENAGISTTKKRGLELATGEYILFMDNDDQLDLKALEVLYEGAKASNADIMLYHAYQVISNQIINMWTYERDLEEQIQQNPLMIYFNGKIRTPLWCKFIKKSYLDQISFPEGLNHCEDSATTASLLMHEPKISFCPQCLYYWFDYSASTSHTPTSRVNDFIYTIEFITDELKKNNLYMTYHPQLDAYVYSIVSFGYDMLGHHPQLQQQLLSFYEQWRISK